MAPIKPGYLKSGVAPMVLPTQGPAAAHATLQTVYGELDVSWKRGPPASSGTSCTVTLDVTIPVSTTASVRVPSVGIPDGSLDIFEGVIKVWDAKSGYVAGVAGITGATKAADGVVFEVKSGSYVFGTKEA